MHVSKCLIFAMLMATFAFGLSMATQQDSENEHNLRSGSNPITTTRNLNDEAAKNSSAEAPKEIEKEIEEERGEAREKFGTPRFWAFLFISIALTLTAGLMSGLTVGYLSIDELVLELKMKNGTEEERKQAEEVLHILEQHHLLLVTLLVANAAAMEALPIFLNKLVPEVLAVLFSVTAVLIFGEIVPQAICTGPNQIAIASALAPYTRTLMMLEAFISYPIALVLDWLLGEHSKCRYKNNDLKALIQLHTEYAVHELEEEKKREIVGLSKEQSKLISGAIDLTACTANEVMKPYENVEVINCRQQLTHKFLEELSGKGYSRYPVYKDDKHNVIGILLVKKLLGLNKFDMSLEKLNIPLRMPLIVHPEMRLTELLMEFQKGKSHIALVTEQTAQLKRKMGLEAGGSSQVMRFEEAMTTAPVEIKGIVTLEDVVERVLGEQILDENDYDKAHTAYLQSTIGMRRIEANLPISKLPPMESSGKILCQDLINKKGSALLDIVKRAESKTGMTVPKQQDAGKSQGVSIPMRNFNEKTVPLLPGSNPK